MKTTYPCIALLIVGLAMALPVSATVITTDAGYTVDMPGVVTGQDGPHSASSGTTISYISYENVLNPFGSGGQAVSKASVSGNLAAGAYLAMGSDVLEMDFQSFSSWSNVFTNTSSSALDYNFDFSFSGGKLQLGENGGLAIFNLDIILNGLSIWNRSAYLTGSPNSGSSVLDTDGLAATISQPAANFYIADFGAFSDSLNLGNYGVGDSFALTYNVGVYSSSIDQDSYVEASVGDPFGTAGFGGFVTSSAISVPEPAGLLLLMLGLLGTFTVQKRSRHE